MGDGVMAFRCTNPQMTSSDDLADSLVDALAELQTKHLPKYAKRVVDAASDGGVFLLQAQDLTDEFAEVYKQAMGILTEMKKHVSEDSGGDWYIVGGFIRAMLAKQSIQDVDVMCTRAPTWRTEMASRGNLGREFVSIPSIPYPLNIISVAHGEPWAAVTEFDFTICQAAVSERGIFVTREFLRDVRDNRLKPTTWLRTCGDYEKIKLSWFRALKYVSYGYDFDPSHFRQIYRQSTALSGSFSR
jgi:hypothetical protein